MEDEYYTSGEKEFLLKIAQKSLSSFLLSTEKFEPQTINKKLWEKRGVFVTLTVNGKLRGCMGNLEPMEALILSVRNNVILAATDPRFDPLKINELKSVEMEIAVLSDLKKTAYEAIKPGDGVWLKYQGKSATYLPSVWKNLKDKKDFLNSLAQKAGLSPALLDDPATEFFVYSVISFGSANH